MAQSHDPAHLLDLVALINRSVQAVLDRNSPHDQSRESLALDSVGSDGAPPPGDLLARETVMILEGACAQLCSNVAPAEHTMLNHAFDMITPACIRIALDARVAEHLRQEPKSTDELGKLTAIDAGKLGRVLRYLALLAKDVFANNKLSACLLPEDTTSAFIRLFVDEFYQGFGHLSEVLLDPEWTSSTDKEKSAFARTSAAHFFKLTETDPVRGARFARAMQGQTKINGGHVLLIESYPWDALPSDSSFCDLGGGVGDAAMALLDAKPHMKVVGQDQPATIRRAHHFWGTRAAAAANSGGRVKLIPIDFFTEAPEVGCAVYYLKHILNVRAAMTDPQAKVLVHEMVLNHDSDAPFPLLPNYGLGAQRAYNMDLNMMAALNGRERSLDEFIGLGEKAGLKYVQVRDGGELKMIEFEAAYLELAWDDGLMYLNALRSVFHALDLLLEVNGIRLPVPTSGNEHQGAVLHCTTC
ncbi:S-adenosyl-L-methionine-dependent methyltransferase [Auricularia subglabra TFB-10046 SS5]|nr:S-adenosyl-L-methionine-dependent methyltransferase [Auricularia subglabra TFB-10046 SS5]